MTYNQIILLVYVVYLFLMSFVAFVLYGFDKRLAKHNDKRIKESRLLGTSVYGGAIGAFLGRIVWHHKTDKIYFSITIYLSLLLEILVLCFLIYMAL